MRSSERPRYLNLFGRQHNLIAMKLSIVILIEFLSFRGFEIGDKKIVVDESQQLLREYGQMKHNLLMELSNYEHEENLSKEDKDTENRIPANTQLETVPSVNYQKRILELNLFATNEVAIKGVVLFAEGIFEGESHVAIPTEVKDQISIPLIPVKDVSVDVHIKALLGHPLSRQLHVFEVTRNLPRFCRFGILQDQEEYVQPAGFVEFKLNQRIPRMIDWILDNFIIPEEYPVIDPEIDLMVLRFVGLEPKLDSYLICKYNFVEGQMRVEHDQMETCGAIVQSLAEYFGIESIESHGIFAEEFAEVENVIQEMDGMYEVRDRLTTELSEKQSILKEIVVRAEDARNIDDMILSRKYYTRLRHVDRAVRQSFLMKTNNHERLVQSLRKLNKLIELAAKLRVGEPSRKIVALSREAISNDNLGIITKIMEFGA